MASEWANTRVEKIIKLSECIHADDCEEPYGAQPCDCWVSEVRQAIAAALDEAEQRGAERERWECHRIAYTSLVEAEVESCACADQIAARGPMRGQEEE